MDSKLNFRKERSLFTQMGSSTASLNYICLGDSVGLLHEIFWQEKVLNMVEAVKHLSGFGLTQIGDSWTSSKALAICIKENTLTSSLMAGLVGCHILC